MSSRMASNEQDVAISSAVSPSMAVMTAQPYSWRPLRKSSSMRGSSSTTSMRIYFADRLSTAVPRRKEWSSPSKTISAQIGCARGDPGPSFGKIHRFIHTAFTVEHGVQRKQGGKQSHPGEEADLRTYSSDRKHCFTAIAHAGLQRRITDIGL